MAGKLRIEHPPSWGMERRYIYHVLLHEFLGSEYVTEVCERQDVRITLDGDGENRELILPDVLFQTPASKWLTAASLPSTPLSWWKLPASLSITRGVCTRIPVLYGLALDEMYYMETNKGVILGIDIFGSAFFMLTRYEEGVKPDRDRYGRFPASASLAFQQGFLERPVVNEYLEVFWAVLQRLWPGLRREPRIHRVLLSHDLDMPLGVVGKHPAWVLGSALADVALRRDVSLALRRLSAYCKVRHGHFDADPYDTFDFVMDLSEQYGRESAFYFMTDHSSDTMDGSYSLDHEWFRALIRRIHQRGHEIGLHTSYNTYLDPVQTQWEFQKLRQVCSEEQVDQVTWGGRQHYLRWANPTTWQNWESAGLDYDHTLTFADHIGFRCGVCYEYPVFNLKTRQSLKLRERPLIVMEGTLLNYMRLAWEGAYDKILALNAVCRSFGGDFTLLWHNHMLISQQQRYWYRMLCAGL